MLTQNSLLTPAMMRQKIGKTLQDLQHMTSFGPTEMAKHLDVDISELQRVFAGLSEPSLIGMKNLADHLGLDFECLLSGNLPEDYIRRGATQYPDYRWMPDRYTPSHHQLALKRSMDGVMAFIVSRHGALFASQLLMRKGISTVAYENLDEHISPMIQVDFIHELRKAGFPDDTFKDMGEAAARLLMQKIPPHLFTTVEDIPDLFEWLIDEYQTGTDKLFKYKLELQNPNQLRLHISPILERIYGISNEIIAHRPFCHFKQGFYRKLPTLCGIAQANLVEHRCLYLGDSSCTYEISW